MIVLEPKGLLSLTILAPSNRESKGAWRGAVLQGYREASGGCVGAIKGLALGSS